MEAATATVVVYALFWLVLLLSIRVNPERGSVKPVLRPRRFSVIVPFRNEKDTVGRMLSSLLNSQQASVFEEIIAVNDHSEDGGEEEVSALALRYPSLRLLHLPPDEQGKKAALRRGIESANSSWCLALDADVMPDASLAGYLSATALPDSGMVLFPVLPREGGGILTALQLWEFVALMELTRGSCRLGAPVLANGACLAFSRAEALGAKGLHPEGASSGDDLALLLHFRRLGAPVRFAEMDVAAVRFSAPENLQAWLSQRLRWTSKLGAYPDAALFLSASCIGLANLASLACLAAWAAGMGSEVLLVPGIKFAVDLLVVLAGSTRWKIKGNPLGWLPMALLVYPLYGSFMVFASFWAKPEWKGRKVQLGDAG